MFPIRLKKYHFKAMPSIIVYIPVLRFRRLAAWVGLDWLALNGVNVVLDLAGQEAVWVLFFQELGYSYEDAKNWLAGPIYYAWQFMDNLEYINGSVP